MEYLNIHEVGKDNLPIDNSMVYLFHSIDGEEIHQGRIEYKWEGSYLKEGNLIEAIGNYGIDIDGDFVDENLEYNKVQLLFCGSVNEFEIRRGDKWCYLHEYYKIIKPNLFPFFDFEYYYLGIEEKWIDLINSEEKSFPNINSKIRTDTIELNSFRLKIKWLKNKFDKYDFLKMVEPNDNI